jgi:hypothetical protein
MDHIVTAAAWGLFMQVDRRIQSRIGRFEIAATVNATALAVAGVVQIVDCIWGECELTDFTNWIRNIAICYYLADLPRCSRLMVLHHIATISIFAFTPSFPWFVSSLLLLEVPLPPLNYALWIRGRGLPVPTWLKAVIVVTYFLTRVAIFPTAYVLHFWRIFAVHPLLPAPYALLVVLGVRWFHEIVSKC